MKFLKYTLIAISGWLTFGSSTVAACPATPMLAQVCPVAFTFAPRGWALAHGQLLAISSNSALFSLLGTMYGGDGRTTFALPDTRSRVVVGAGRGAGLSDYRQGHRGGLEHVTLTQLEMPSHSHTVTHTINVEIDISGTADIHAVNGNAAAPSPASNVLAKVAGSNNIYSGYDSNTPPVDMHPDSATLSIGAINASATATTTIGHIGSSQSHENRMPSIAMYWVIALQGVYPSRS